MIIITLKIFKKIDDDNSYMKNIQRDRWEYLDQKNIQRDRWEYLDQKNTTKLSSLNV